MASAEHRAMAMAAAAFLPGLLPTPPRSAMITPCIVILPPPASNPKHPKPGRADYAERWDAHKDKPRSPASSSCGSTSPGRADSCQRWEINKIKKNPISSGSATSSSMPISGDSRGTSSAERWDEHKEPAHDTVISDAESRTGDQAQAQQMSEDKEEEEEEEEEEDETMLMDMEETTAAPWFVDRRVLFSGPSFFVASPEPSMLPMPTFLSRRAAGKIHDLPSMSILQLH